MKPILINQAIADLAPFASTDRCLTSLNGIHLNDKHAEATDGRVLLRVPLPAHPSVDDFPPCPGAGEDFSPVTLPAKPLAECLATVKREKFPVLRTVRVATTGDGEQIMAQLSAAPGGQVMTRPVTPMDGQWPNMDAVIPTTPASFSICLSPELLGKICTWAVKHGATNRNGVEGMRLEFTDELSPVRITIQRQDAPPALAVLMPMRMA